MGNLTTYTTPVHGAVLIGGILRDMCVRVFNGVPRVVEPAHFRPLTGYSPLLPHYTRKSLTTLAIAADAEGYHNKRFDVLVAHAFDTQAGVRGTKELEDRNLFELVAHMTQWDKDHWTDERVQQLIIDLAAQY